MVTPNPRDESCKFSKTNHTPEFVISSNCRSATCVSEPNALLGWGKCANPTTTFAVRVSKLSNVLYLGFSLPDWPIEDPTNFEKGGWFIFGSNTSLFERGQRGPTQGTPLKEGSVVSVEKDSQTRSLRFRIDGAHLADVDGHPFGWRQTGLSQEEFDSLVGAIEMLKGGAVDILE